MGKTKKPFKDTKAAKIIKGVLNGALDVLPIPDPRKYFDTDQDGKVTVKDLSNVKWIQVGGAVIAMAALIKFEIIDIDTVVILIEKMMGG